MKKELSLTKSMLVIVLTICFLGGIVAQDRLYTIQVASLETSADAEILVKKIKDQSLDAYLMQVDLTGIGRRYRVRIGSFNSQISARKQAEVWRKRGVISDYIVTVYQRHSDGIDLQVHNSSPPPALQKIKRPPVDLIVQMGRDLEGLKKCIDSCGIEAISQILELEEIDLNRDEQPEYVIRSSSSTPGNCKDDSCYLCGARRCDEWMYSKDVRGYRFLLELNSVEYSKALTDTMINNYYPVVAVSPPSHDGSISMTIYEFQGDRYQEQNIFDSAKYRWPTFENRFRNAIQKRDRNLLKDIIDEQFEYLNDKTYTPLRLIKLIDKQKAWREINQALNSGFKTIPGTRNDYQSPTLMTNEGGLVFQFSATGFWLWVAVVKK